MRRQSSLLVGLVLAGAACGASPERGGADTASAAATPSAPAALGEYGARWEFVFRSVSTGERTSVNSCPGVIAITAQDGEKVSGTFRSEATWSCNVVAGVVDGTLRPDGSLELAMNVPGSPGSALARITRCSGVGAEASLLGALAADRLEATTSGVFDCPGQRVEERQRAAVTLVAIAGATTLAPPPVPGLPVAPPPAPTMPGPAVPAPEPPAAPHVGVLRRHLPRVDHRGDRLCSDGTGTPDRSRQTSWTLSQAPERGHRRNREPLSARARRRRAGGRRRAPAPEDLPAGRDRPRQRRLPPRGGTLYLSSSSLTATTSWVRDEYDAAGNLVRRCRTRASATLGR